MGWSFRKSINFGPFRVNLSKSGVGMSTGVKGARISTGPRGTRFTASKYGFTYTKTLASRHRGKLGFGAGFLGLAALVVYWLSHH